MPSPPSRSYGFLGGSFDPPQKGHVALALAALRERHLARVYLVPAFRSPLKTEGPRASVLDRAALVRGAIRGCRGLALGPWEMGRSGPSYTYQTLRRLRKKYPQRRWEVIVGEDAWRTFHSWRRWREILRHCTLVVGKRALSAGERGPSEAVFLRSRLPTVSSTEIRRALVRGRSIRRWVGAPVLGLINKKGLYRNPD